MKKKIIGVMSALMGLSATAASAFIMPFSHNDMTEANRLREKLIEKSTTPGVTLLLTKPMKHAKVPWIFVRGHGSHYSHGSHWSHVSHTSGSTSQIYGPSYTYPTPPPFTANAIPGFASKTLEGQKGGTIFLSLPTHTADFPDIHYILKRSPLNGTISISEDGTIMYTPDKDFVGKDVFSVVANNGYQDTEEIEFHVTISPLGE